MTKRILCAMLSLLMLIPALVACSDDTPEDTTADTAGDTTAVTTTEETTFDREHTPDTLPELNFNGDTVTVRVRGDGAKMLVAPEETGEAVNDAVYQRNQMVSERLNIVIEPSLGEGWQGYNTEIATIRGSIQAGDGAFDVLAGWSAKIPALALEGLFVNLNEVKHLDLGQPWWNKSIIKDLQIANQLHFLVGDVCYTSFGQLVSFFYNKKVAQDRNVENLYQVVWDGKWTIDYLNTLISDMYIDLDGDGTRSALDSYGLAITTVNQADAFLQGSLTSMVSRDKSGIPVLDVDTEHLANLVDKVYRLMWENPGCIADTKGTVDYAMFKEDRALFIVTWPSQIPTNLADMESDYGILPYPKLSEDQVSYGSRIQDGLNLWCIPVDAKNTDLSGAFLEAMAAQGYRTFIPAYYETTLKLRYSRDPETSEMVDLIRDSTIINFEQLYNESIGNPWFVLRKLMTAKDNNFASYWATNKPVIEKALADAVEKIEALN